VEGGHRHGGGFLRLRASLVLLIWRVVWRAV
jgi:hypothetical protein